MSTSGSSVVSLYVIKTADGNYFGGFDPSKDRAVYVDDALCAKKFTNKYDVKLRPDEFMVEITVDLKSAKAKLSEPFRAPRRVKSPIKQ